MKNGMDHYAIKVRLGEKGYFRKHTPRGKGWKATETSNCDCDVKSGKQEEEIELLTQPDLPLCLQELVEEEIKWYREVVLDDKNETKRRSKKGRRSRSKKEDSNGSES